MPGGGFAVTYVTTGNLDYTIWVSSYGASGAPIGSPVNVHTGGALGRPLIAAGSNGDMVVVWTYGNTTTDVRGRRLTTSATVGAVFDLQSVATGTQSKPRVAVAGDGSFVATWLSDHATRRLGYVRRFSASGVPLSAESLVSPHTGAGTDAAEIGIDANGSFSIVWFGNGGPVSDAYSNVWRQDFDNAGARVGPVTRVNAFEPGDQEASDMAMSSTGQGVAVWEDGRQEWSPNGSSSMLQSGIYAASF